MLSAVSSHASDLFIEERHLIGAQHLRPLTENKFQNLSSHHMDEREHPYEALSICNRLYNFVSKSLVAHAFKTLTLGTFRSRGTAKTQSASVVASKYDQAVHPTSQAESRGAGTYQWDCVEDSDSAVQSSSSGKDLEKKGEESPATTSNNTDATEGIADRLDAVDDRKKQEDEVYIALVSPTPNALKKSVSINERVEEIDIGKKKTRRKKSKEERSSLEEQAIQEPRPILKLSSDSGKRSGYNANLGIGG